MDFTVQLALDHNKGIDIHLHEAGESGMKTINYLIDKAIENPVLQENICAMPLPWLIFLLKKQSRSQKDWLQEK
jgi:hypothetical protein